jgi:uroporphyrinogen III methyltransferase / synthase
MASTSGTVYLVGAGPGDAGLLTIRGAECLASAGAVVYDFLANEALLAYAPADAERVYVGKQAGQHAKSQSEINDLLVQHARAGRTVVRLKGGDPFLFGRGGEEAIHLREHGIAFEVVPGVSSAIAVPAYAGIPVTHRRINVSLHIVTGHEDDEKDEAGIEWDVLARTEGTLVFMMGVGNLGRIVHELTSRGKPADTPIAVIRWGTMPEQETLVSTLARVTGEVRKRNFHPPAVIVIGPVVELRELINWAESKPLFGMRIALTRPREQSARLAATLRQAGADVVITPSICIVPRELSPAIHRELEMLSGYDWVVFTSANGVGTFMQLLFEMKLDARALANCRIAAIGTRTADALLAAGLRADTVPGEFTQESLSHALRVTRGDRVLIPRASVARDVLEKSLEERGAKVHSIPMYDTIADRTGIADLRHALTRGRIHLATFTSASTIQKFAEAVKEEDIPRLFADVTIASIGPVTSDALRAHRLQVHVEAKTATAEGLAEAILEHRARAKH